MFSLQFLISLKLLQTGWNCMTALVIYFSLMKIRPLNRNLSGGKHQLAQATWAALHGAVLEIDVPILPCSHIHC